MKYWKRIDNQGKTIGVESYSFDADIKGAVEITQQEFDAYLAKLPPMPPARDLAKEITELQVKVAVLEGKVK